MGWMPAAQDQPSWASPVLFTIFAILWLGIFSWFARRLTFDFDLVRHKLRWSQWSLFGKKSGVISFTAIRRATVEETGDHEGGLEYRPVLLTHNGTFPLLNYSTSGFFAKSRFNRIVTAINAAPRLP